MDRVSTLSENPTLIALEEKLKELAVKYNVEFPSVIKAEDGSCALNENSELKYAVVSLVAAAFVETNDDNVFHIMNFFFPINGSGITNIGAGLQRDILYRAILAEVYRLQNTKADSAKLPSSMVDSSSGAEAMKVIG